MRHYATVYQTLTTDLSPHLPRNWNETSSFVAGSADAEGWSDQNVAAALQVGAFHKKLAPNGQSVQAILDAEKKFRAINSSLTFCPPDSRDDEAMTYQLSLFKDFVWTATDMDSEGSGMDLAYMANHFKAGPGASRLATSRNFYSKMFDSDHSYTSPYLLALFRAALTQSETFSDAYLHWNRTFKSVEVKGNAFFTVRKNAEISRTCSTEPLVNMLVQQACGSYIEEFPLARLGIRLDRQPDINRRLTKLGSIDGSFGTTDLSSASDCMAVDLIKWSVAPSFLKWLLVCRSQTTRFPNGQEEELRMIGTMGNGFTFPLQTLIFACAVKAVYVAKGLVPLFTGQGANASVFGDDIVVRKDCFVAINKLLVRLGFTVNDLKSFNSSPFRESCGFDYWNGRNVRPVYLETLEASHDVYSFFNRLSRWSAENRIPTVRTLALLSRMARFLPIPFSDADDAGFKVPLVLAPLRHNDSFWTRYKKVVAISTVERVPKDLKEAVKLGYKDFNPFGWEVSFLGGYARNPGGTFRIFDPVTQQYQGIMNDRSSDGIHRRPFQGEVLPRRYRTSFIPHWDWLGIYDSGRFRPESFQYWEILVAAAVSAA